MKLWHAFVGFFVFPILRAITAVYRLGAVLFLTTVYAIAVPVLRLLGHLREQEWVSFLVGLPIYPIAAFCMSVLTLLTATCYEIVSVLWSPIQGFVMGYRAGTFSMFNDINDMFAFRDDPRADWITSSFRKLSNEMIDSYHPLFKPSTPPHSRPRALTTEEEYRLLEHARDTLLTLEEVQWFLDRMNDALLREERQLFLAYLNLQESLNAASKDSLVFTHWTENDEVECTTFDEPLSVDDFQIVRIQHHPVMRLSDEKGRVYGHYRFVCPELNNLAFALRHIIARYASGNEPAFDHLAASRARYASNEHSANEDLLRRRRKRS